MYMNVQLLMSGVLLVSLLTSLTTEAIKKLMNEDTKCYNLIAVICSIVLSIAVSVGYVILNGLGFNSEIVITIIAMVFMSFLASTLGYDKVKQTIEQLMFKKTGSNDEGTNA